ncbi:ATPase AAA [Candidatus Paracaedimonas acanthamoebae]|nr:ATPase AAA [Candidatus Paracaedimonas acanthamoebae]
MATNKEGTQPAEFSPVRAALWPIYAHELKKFLPMGMIMFFILFNYTILRDVKDVLIMTAPNSGAGVLSFLKGWGVMPSAILFVLLYTKLSNIVNRERLFYGIVVVFIAFFGLFAFYLYPNRELIHPSLETIQNLQANYPNLKWIFPIYGVWTYSLFYVLAELWGSVMISLLFWQFANDITRTEEAKRFYAMFGLIANVALIFSGTTVEYFSEIKDKLPPEIDAWGYSLNYMMGAVVLCGVAAIALYWWVTEYVLTDPRFYDASAPKNKKEKKDKPKLSVGESFKLIFSSPYIGYIAILVLAYGVSINLIEVVWKDQLKQAFPNPNDYGAFMGKFSRATGIVTMLLIWFTKGIVRKFGWFTGAIVTPAVLIITGALFFAFVLFKDELTPLVAGFGLTATLMATYIGAIQNILSKGTKYSNFDPTKEMAYIPLDQELKVKGKAAVDVIGGRLGKAGGGYVQQGLLIATAGDIMTIAPYLAGVVGVVVGAWVIAVKGLSKKYNALIKKTAA